MKIKLNENKLNNIIQESINKILKENTNTYKFNLFYIDKDSNKYDGHFWDSIEALSIKDAINKWLPQLERVLIGNLDGEKVKEDNYRILRINPNDEDDYDQDCDLTIYTQNGKKVHHKYSYFDEDSNYNHMDSYEKQNAPKFSATIMDWLGRDILEIPKGYCTNITLTKKFIKNYLKKQEQGEYGVNCNIRIFIFNKKDMKYYRAYYDASDDSFGIREIPLSELF